MTAHQIQAPPTEAEEKAGASLLPGSYDGTIPRSFEVWTEDDGWCSACLSDRDGLRVVLFGGENRCVGLCSYCLSRLADAMRQPSPNRSKE